VTAEARFPLDDFELYHQAREFRRKVYRLIRQLPPEERYCLDPQMRKAAVSITNNLAEGHGRWHHQETIQFCRVSRGSVEEILDDVNVCLDEGYGDETLNLELKQDGYALVLKINSSIAYLRKRRQGVTEQVAEYASPDDL
jgi:four helix bundle protein